VGYSALFLGALTDSVRVLVLTASIENKDILEALQRGARGVVLKESATEVLRMGIRAVPPAWCLREFFFES